MHIRLVLPKTQPIKTAEMSISSAKQVCTIEYGEWKCPEMIAYDGHKSNPNMIFDTFDCGFNAIFAIVQFKWIFFKTINRLPFNRYFFE